MAEGKIGEGDFLPFERLNNMKLNWRQQGRRTVQERARFGVCVELQQSWKEAESVRRWKSGS